MLRSFIFATLLGVSACSSNSPTAAFDTRINAGPCPTAGAIYDTSRIVEFDGGATSYSDISYSAEIVGVRLFCRYVEDDPLVAEVEIDFAFGKGPSGEASRHVFPYFVAVTRRGGKVLSKERFAVQADFGRDTVAASTEMVDRIVIPRADNTISGVNFEILVGFDLTPEQLGFNRGGNRFRLAAADAARDSAR